MLAGGGVKVAFQAGVLQVLLDETDLEFDHADGASGGMLQPGDALPGAVAAARSRTTGVSYGPLRVVQPNWRLIFGESIARTRAAASTSASRTGASTST